MAYNIEDFPIETTDEQIEVILPLGRHVLELVVEDSAGLRSAPDTVVITVERKAAPEIIDINPNRGRAGVTVNAVITGKNLLGATGVKFSGLGMRADIKAGGTAEELPVRIQIDAGAATGPRTFYVITPGGTAQSVEGLFHVDRFGPTVTGPTVTRPTVTRPTVTRPTVTRPTVTRPISTVPIITRPIVPPRAPERLVEIRGIGPASEEKLHTAGIRSVKDLALASPERVAEILGIRDMNKAKAFIDEAKRLIR